MKNKSSYTIIHLKDVPKFNLPCNLYSSFAGKLPEQTILFENPSDGKLLTMTVSETPELVETRKECGLTDEQLERLKNFIHREEMVIILHNRGVLSKKDFIRAIKGKRKLRNIIYTWIRDFDVYKGHNPIKQAFRWIALKMWDYQEARELDCVFKNKHRTSANDCNFLQYLILSLFFEDEETQNTTQRGEL